MPQCNSGRVLERVPIPLEVGNGSESGRGREVRAWVPLSADSSKGGDLNAAKTLACRK